MAEGGWMSRADQPVFVRAVGVSAGAVLTIYKASGGMPTPEFRIRRISSDMTAPGPGGGPGAAPPADAEVSLPLGLLVHVQTVGDVKALAPEWAGRPGSGRQVEGFSIAPVGPLGADDFEYQAILGEEWNTPWSRAGAFCGSRGMGLPLLGFRVRLTGAASAQYECRYWGSFANQGLVGPLSDGAACEADRAFLEAMRVVITPRSSQRAASAEDHAPASLPEGGVTAGGVLVAPGAKPAGKPRRSKK
jgi:hypothetical protein